MLKNRIIPIVFLLTVAIAIVTAVSFNNARVEDIPSYDDLIIPFSGSYEDLIDYMYTYKVPRGDESIPVLDSFPPWIIREKLAAICDEINIARYAVEMGTKTRETKKYFKPEYKKLLLDINRVWSMERFNVVMVGITNLTNKKIHTFKQIFPDAHYVVFVDSPRGVYAW